MADFDLADCSCHPLLQLSLLFAILQSTVISVLLWPASDMLNLAAQPVFLGLLILLGDKAAGERMCTADMSAGSTCISYC